MNWKRWFGLADEPSSAAPDSDYWYNDVPGGGFWMGPAEALKVTAVDACIRVLAETIASLPLHVYERTDNGREMARNHPTYAPLHSVPNDYQTAYEFWEYAVRQVLTQGAFLARLVEDSKRNVTGMVPIDWSRVSIMRDRDTGIRTFSVSGDADEDSRAYVDSEVLFIPGPGATPWKVRSLVDIHAGAIGLSLKAQEYVRNYFSRGATGPVYASFPMDMSDVAMEKWRVFLAKHFGGAANSGRIPIMGGGGKLESIPIKHSEMQLVELRRFQIEEIARVFRVAPHLIQDLSRSTNNNIEHQSLDFAMHSIRPWLERLEARINASLYGPIEGQRFYAEFDMEGLLRGDSAGRAAIMGATVQNGIMAPNEWRDRMNLNRRPEGDDLLIQGAVIPLRLAGQQQQQGVTQ